MSYLNPSSRTITAFFDTRSAADRAANDLTSLGVSQHQVRITEGADPSAPAAPADKSFWEELKDFFMPSEDRYGYAEGLRRGGFLLSAQVDDTLYDRALEMVDTDGAVNMDERESSWRASGWTGYQSETAAPVAGLKENITGGVAVGAAAANTRLETGNTPVEAGKDGVIPVYEESVKVGKREVDHGRVRVRSYVVETPISEQVNLRNEQVQVERRPVDRPVAAGDAVFKDRVIEAEERVEEPVISKETRVKEEIGLRKTVENQSQTVSDTVRRTEVEVQDERAGASLGTAQRFVPSTDSRQIAEHMDVIASDGTKIGSVDHLDGDRIKLTKSSSLDGQHHFIPLTFVDHVDAHVHLSKSAAEAKASW